MKKTNVADHLVACLEAEGVRHIFGYPGGAALPIYDALARRGTIEHVLVRHEQSAAHAADGYARASGQVGVCLTSSGPGVTNALTGIATAYMDSIPMVILTGQAPSRVLGTDAFQEVDTVGITRACVKHSFLLSDPDRMEEVVQKAFHIARTGRPGPVLIDLPRDISETVMQRDFAYAPAVAIRAYRDKFPLPVRQIQMALAVLATAERPLIYYGGGVVTGNAAEPLQQLAKLLGAPVTSTLMGLGAFPADNPQFIGMLGMHGLYEANMAMQHCDVLIAIGARFDDRVIGNTKDFARPRRRIIHIDVDPTSISKRVAVDIPIVGDCATVLQELVTQIPQDTKHAHRSSPWWLQIKTWQSLQCLAFDSDGPRIKPQRVLELLSEQPGSEDFIVSTDVGQHQMWAAQHFKFQKSRRWITSGGLGTMGFGLPAAMGAYLANPGATVICITGDGSIQMSTKELSTCMQYDIPIKIICLNNSSLGMVRQQQDLYHDRRRSQSYMETIPDFVKLAEAYGHRGVRVENPEDLSAVISDVVADKKRLVFVDVVTDRNENVYPTIAPEQPLTQMLLRPRSEVLAEEL